MKRIKYLFIITLILYSCDNLIAKKEKQEDLLKEKWSTIDTTKVEEPPLFEQCKHDSGEDLQNCFHKTIRDHIGDYLSEHTITIKETINDTIWVPILITKNDEIVLENFVVPNMIQIQIPDFKDILEESIQSLPKVEAAHTRGVPVNARYKLPLVININ